MGTFSDNWGSESQMSFGKILRVLCHQPSRLKHFLLEGREVLIGLRKLMKLRALRKLMRSYKWHTL